MKRTMPLAVGDRVTLEVEGLTHRAEGVGRFQGLAVFVPRSLPGELVEGEVISLKKNYARAVPLRVLRPSPDRVEPPCPVFGACGGCSLLHARYKAQLAYKKERITVALEKIGSFPRPPVASVLEMTEPLGYRSKAHFPVVQGKTGLTAGCYRVRSHEVVPVESCAIQHPAINGVMTQAISILQELRVEPYREVSGRGLLRSILVRRVSGGAMFVLFVLNGESLPGEEEVVRELTARSGEPLSVALNINGEKGNRLLGARTRHLAGPEHLLEHVHDLRFKLSATSFFQVNTTQGAVLCDLVRRFAALRGGEKVLDLYSGVGVFALILAAEGRRVTGIERAAAAVQDARANAKLNGIRGARFLEGDSEKVLPSLSAAGENFDLAILNPPRAGCHPALLKSLASAGVPRLVYVSCNPETLARDLSLLSTKGYSLECVQPVDMFPQTAHVETVALVTRGRRH